LDKVISLIEEDIFNEFATSPNKIKQLATTVEKSVRNPGQKSGCIELENDVELSLINDNCENVSSGQR
jgi:hypothetical protein